LALETKVFSPGDEDAHYFAEMARKAELPEAIWQDIVTAMTNDQTGDAVGKLWDQLSLRVRRYLLHGTTDEPEPEKDAGTGLDDFLKGLL